jgi:hypothetical protein
VPVKTGAALFSHLNKLKRLPDLVRTEPAPAQGHKDPKSKKGNYRDLYALAVDTAITWAPTARIVMAVWDSPGFHITEDTLIRKMEALQLPHF